MYICLAIILPFSLLVQVISASVDGSVRLWYRRTGHFLDSLSVCFSVYLSLFVKRFSSLLVQVISASVDGSVRLWYRRTGHFLGYFGQYSAFFRPKTPQLMKILTSDVPPVLPSDIQGQFSFSMAICI